MLWPNEMFVRRQTIAAALVTLSVAGSSCSVVLGQDQSAATSQDAIVARKTAMNTLSDRMDLIEAAIASGKKIDLEEGHGNADVISVLLMAFPHLFPPSTNQWKPNVDRDPATDTYASPDVWTKFADFYKQAMGASKAAFDATAPTTRAPSRPRSRNSAPAATPAMVPI